MSDSKIFFDRRQYPRINASLPVKYRSIDDQREVSSLVDRKKNDIIAQTVDVSLGGIFLSPSEVIVKVGSILKVDVEVPGRTDKLSAFAEVVWTNDSGSGLRFLAIKDEDLAFLTEYLHKV